MNFASYSLSFSGSVAIKSFKKEVSSGKLFPSLFF